MRITAAGYVILTGEEYQSLCRRMSDSSALIEQQDTLQQAMSMSIAGAGRNLEQLKSSIARLGIDTQEEIRRLKLEHTAMLEVIKDFADTLRQASLAAYDCTCMRASEIPDIETADESLIRDWLRRVLSASIRNLDALESYKHNYYGSHGSRQNTDTEKALSKKANLNRIILDNYQKVEQTRRRLGRALAQREYNAQKALKYVDNIQESDRLSTTI